MAKKWACRTYYNVNPFIGVSLHDGIVPSPLPPFQIPAILPHIDFSVVQGLWIGSFLTNRKKAKILGDGLLFVGRTSDAGFVVPHISFPPSWMNLITTLFGSSMAVFGSSSVCIAAKNVLYGNEECDMAATPFGSVPLSVNVGCFEPFAMPTDVVVVWGTVYSGMSWADMLAAAIDFAIAIVTDIISGLLGKAGSWAGGKVLKKVMGGGKAVFKATVKEAVDEAMQGAVEEGTSAAVKKVAREAAQEAAKKAAKEAAQAGAKEASEEGVEAAIKKAAKEAAEDSIAKGAKRSTFKSWLKEAAGMTPSQQWSEYVSKSVELQGMMRGADLDDAAIAKIATEQGFDDAFVKQLADLDTGTDKTITKFGKYLDDLDVLQEGGESAWKNAGDSADDVLTQALKNLEDATNALGKSEGDWLWQYKGLKKFAQKVLWTHLIRNMNWMGEGTEGGAFSVDGLGWNIGPLEADMLHPDSRRWDEKWYMGLLGVDMATLGTLLDDVSEGLVAQEQDASWSGRDEDDYWWESLGGGITEPDPEEDYWWNADVDDLASTTTAPTLVSAEAT